MTNDILLAAVRHCSNENRGWSVHLRYKGLLPVWFPSAFSQLNPGLSNHFLSIFIAFLSHSIFTPSRMTSAELSDKLSLEGGQRLGLSQYYAISFLNSESINDYNHLRTWPQLYSYPTVTVNPGQVYIKRQEFRPTTLRLLSSERRFRAGVPTFVLTLFSL